MENLNTKSQAKVWDILNQERFSPDQKIKLIRAIFIAEERKEIQFHINRVTRELKDHIKFHRIDPELSKQAKELLAQGVPIDLLWNNSREQVFGVRIREAAF